MRPVEPWRDLLAFRVAVHDTIVAGDRLLGRSPGADYERAREAVVEVIDQALAAGVSEVDVNMALVAYRADAQSTTEAA